MLNGLKTFEILDPISWKFFTIALFWYKVVWLVVAHHVTNFNQSLCFISLKLNYAHAEICLWYLVLEQIRCKSTACCQHFLLLTIFKQISTLRDTKIWGCLFCLLPTIKDTGFQVNRNIFSKSKMYPYNNNLTKLLHSNSPRGFYCATDFIEMFHLFLVKGGDCCKLLSFAHSKKLDWFTNQDRNESNMMQLLAGCGLDLSGHYHTPLFAQTILIRFEYSHHLSIHEPFSVVNSSVESCEGSSKIISENATNISI